MYTLMPSGGDVEACVDMFDLSMQSTYGTVIMALVVYLSCLASASVIMSLLCDSSSVMSWPAYLARLSIAVIALGSITMLPVSMGWSAVMMMDVQVWQLLCAAYAGLFASAMFLLESDPLALSQPVLPVPLRDYHLASRHTGASVALPATFMACSG